MLHELLNSHLRMRASLLAILDLDPPSISARIEEMDAEIARLRNLTRDAFAPRDELSPTSPDEAALRAA